MGNELSYVFCCKTRREYLEEKQMNEYDDEAHAVFCYEHGYAPPDKNKSGYRSAQMDGDSRYKPRRPRFPMGNEKLYD